MARLVKAGTPRVLPAEGEYTAEEQLWLAAAEAAGKKAKGKGGKPAKTPDARSARRENARACREAVQGDKRSREAQAGETSPAQSLAAWHAFAGQYFPALADRPAVVHGGGVLLPVPFPQTNLHVLRAGVFVGSVQKGRFVPEHHLFTAFGAQCVNREELTLDDPRCVEYLSGREVEARIAADGWCCVTVDGWPLGGGKVSGGRVKTIIPRRCGCCERAEKSAFFPRRMLKTGRIRLERSARLCYNNRVRFCVLPQCGRPQPVCPQAEI